MKNIIIIFTLIVLSQFSYSQGAKFGIILEPQISYLVPDVENINQDGSRMGFNIGLAVENYFAENYAFATGISINNTGGRLAYDTTSSIITTSATKPISAGTSVIYKLQYVTIPIGLKLKTNDIGNLKITCNIGLTSQINIKAKAYSEINNIEDENIKENEIKPIDLGYHIGAGAEYGIGGSSAIAVSVIYTNGFMDITDGKEDITTLGSVALRIGLMF